MRARPAGSNRKPPTLVGFQAPASPVTQDDDDLEFVVHTVQPSSASSVSSATSHTESEPIAVSAAPPANVPSVPFLGELGAKLAKRNSIVQSLESASTPMTPAHAEPALAISPAATPAHSVPEPSSTNSSAPNLAVQTSAESHPQEPVSTHQSSVPTQTPLPESTQPVVLEASQLVEPTAEPQQLSTSETSQSQSQVAQTSDYEAPAAMELEVPTIASSSETPALSVIEPSPLIQVPSEPTVAVASEPQSEPPNVKPIAESKSAAPSDTGVSSDLQSTHTPVHDSAPSAHSDSIPVPDVTSEISDESKSSTISHTSDAQPAVSEAVQSPAEPVDSSPSLEAPLSDPHAQDPDPSIDSSPSSLTAPDSPPPIILPEMDDQSVAFHLAHSLELPFKSVLSCRPVRSLCLSLSLTHNHSYHLSPSC